MKFLFPVIEKYFEKFKNFNNPVEFLKFFFIFWYSFWNSRGYLPQPAGGGFEPTLSQYIVLNRPPVNMVTCGGSAILSSPMVTIQA